MKIEKFLKWIQEKLLYYPEISITTVKMFIQEFSNCLSEKERKKWNIPLNIISEFTLKQISIDQFVQETIINNLTKELDDLKNGKA